MSEQTWNHDTYEKSGRFVSDLGMPVVDLLAPTPGESILDLGCGDGVLTKKLQDLGCQVLGMDASPDFVQSTRALGLDGQALSFKEEFDAVFSNAALHWMKNMEAVIDGVWRALKPGGRFVAEMGGQGNVAQIHQALESALKKRGLSVENPNCFPSPETYSALLTARGFQVESIQLIPRPTRLPGDLKTWVETFAKDFLAPIPQAQLSDFLEEVQTSLKPRLQDPQGRWTADYVRLRFKALKPVGPSLLK